MTKYLISTPQAGFTGISVGVNFTNGQAEVDSETQAAALRYFRAQGYGVEEAAAEAAGAEPSAPVPTFADDPAIAPAGNASEADWRAHCLAIGATEDQVKDLKRDQLKELAAKITKEQTA